MLKRMLTALVLFPIFLIAVWQGGWIFNSLSLLIAVLGGYEWFKLLKFSSFHSSIAGALTGVLTLLFVLYQAPVSIFGVLWFFALLRVFVHYSQNILAIMGPFLIGGAAYCFIQSYAIHPYALLIMLVLIILSDSGAYFTGKAFGKHKLAPSISPAKTWEGAAGGMLFALAFSVAVAPLMNASIYVWIPFTIFLVIVGILGDLFESALKRQAGVKDSGTLLPGHGGILDRVDAHLPVAVCMAIFLQLGN